MKYAKIVVIIFTLLCLTIATSAYADLRVGSVGATLLMPYNQVKKLLNTDVAEQANLFNIDAKVIESVDNLNHHYIIEEINWGSSLPISIEAYHFDLDGKLQTYQTCDQSNDRSAIEKSHSEFVSMLTHIFGEPDNQQGTSGIVLPKTDIIVSNSTEKELPESIYPYYYNIPSVSSFSAEQLSQNVEQLYNFSCLEWYEWVYTGDNYNVIISEGYIQISSRNESESVYIALANYAKISKDDFAQISAYDASSQGSYTGFDYHHPIMGALLPEKIMIFSTSMKGSKQFQLDYSNEFVHLF